MSKERLPIPLFDMLTKDRRSVQTAARFWSRVNKQGADECWNWTGAKRTGKGYCDAHFRIGTYTTAIAPRVAFVLGTRVDPRDALVLHRCDNSLCCNPAHLYLGTQADNNRDTISRNRCPRRCKNKPGNVGQQKEERN